ncbi:progranulin-like [Scleropages formosus]|uniref:Progranulin-like n=1 Tax=Scleropages formosus TaxID=113540 RepID=A0A8C9RLG5_SCLFO|nr:progranulin-like [Scleropages formosus]
MLEFAVVMTVGAQLAFGSLVCPNGNVCPDTSTCCSTEYKDGCCPYPKAVCCPGRSRCCPEGYECNVQAQMCEKLGVESMPMLQKTQAEEPAAVPALSVQAASSVVHCDAIYVCPDGTTCCRHPAGLYTCCPLSPAQCCLDGYHCCPWGYNCDPTYTRCVRNGVPHPFFVHKPMSIIKATKVSTAQDELQQTVVARSQNSVIICDVNFYCPMGNTCCKSPAGKWGCCPYPLGQCCKDGEHCCEYGFKCDRTSKECIKGYLRVPSALKQAQQI